MTDRTDELVLKLHAAWNALAEVTPPADLLRRIVHLEQLAGVDAYAPDRVYPEQQAALSEIARLEIELESERARDAE